MHKAYKDDNELCKWLKENSSGIYRLSGYAAERIETLSDHLSNVQRECDKQDATIAQQAERIAEQGEQARRQKKLIEGKGVELRAAKARIADLMMKEAEGEG